MRIKIAVFLFMLICGNGYSQPSHQLQTDVKKLYIAFDEIDIDKLSAMILSSSEPSVVYDKLDAYFLNDDQKFRFVYTNAKFNYSDIKVIDGSSYCAINFRNVVRITYFNPIDVDDIQKTLKSRFNAQSVVYEKARNSFLIVYNAKMIATPTNGVWQFAFIDSTLPSDISEGKITENIKKGLGVELGTK